MITDVKIKPGCISCKTCERICPSIFKVEGTSTVVSDKYQENASAIIEAAQNCPVQVIAVTDSSSANAYSEKESFDARLIEKRALTDDTFEFVFSAPEEVEFTPGQFATVTLKDRKGEFARCYSIKSWEPGKITFCIKVFLDGRGGKVLASMKDGGAISMRAGVGTFVLKETKKPKVFIVTGTGIAPVMAMLDAIDPEVPKKILFGLRTEKDMFYLDEFKKYKNLDVEIWLSDVGNEYQGNKGRVTDSPMMTELLDGKEREVYLCGNPYMIDDVVDRLNKSGSAHLDISYEHFTSSSVSTGAAKTSILSDILVPALQRILLVAAALTPLQYFFPQATPVLWDWSLYTVILLMMIRPLRDLFPGVLAFSRLIVLRKELGIFSASVVAATAAIHYLSPGFDFLGTYFSLDYWSFAGNLFWAHIAELTGIILLLTSNSFSQKVLGRNWKRIQRLSYVYFFGGAFYVWASFGKAAGLWGIIVVFSLTILAFVKNHFIKKHA